MGSLEHSVQVFRWMKNQKNFCARNDIYTMMIRLNARHNRVDQARGLFFEMQKWRYACLSKYGSCTPFIFSLLAIQLIILGKMEKKKKTWRLSHHLHLMF